MIRACILAIMLIAASADATGLWLDGREQIASSSSVVTNDVVSTNSVGGNLVTNGTFASGIDGWADPFNSSLAYDSATESLVMNVSEDSRCYTTPSGPWTTDALTISFTYTITNDFWDAGTLVGPSPIFRLYINSDLCVLDDATLSNTVGTFQFSKIYTIFTNGFCSPATTTLSRTSFTFSVYDQWGGGHTNKAGFLLDNFFWGTPATNQIVTNSVVTTNSGSGAGGPTLDGRVPLSTNRHTYLNGVRQ